MTEGVPDSTNNPFFELLNASEKIRSGIKGQDYLVLENDDEMYGYSTMPFEDELCKSSDKVIELLTADGPSLLAHEPKLGAMVIIAMVQVQPAADAYRSRMFQYATDWGSEISPAASCQTKLLDCLKEVIAKLSPDTLEQISNELPKDIKSKIIYYYFWTDVDRHGSASIRVSDLLSL